VGILFMVLAAFLFVPHFVRADAITLRLYPGAALYINNPEGKDFDVTLDVRDINVYENGPREVLVKIYKPDGTTAAREYIPDDGITGGVFTERLAGWDHQLQYAAIQKMQGLVPTIRSSALSDPARLTRTYRFNADSIDCEVALADSDYKEVLSLWTQQRKWSEVRLAYEMIPFGTQRIVQEPDSATTVTVLAADGKELGVLTETPAVVRTIKIDRGGYGVRIELAANMSVHRGRNRTVTIQLTDKEAPAAAIGLKYRLVPYQ